MAILAGGVTRSEYVQQGIADMCVKRNLNLELYTLPAPQLCIALGLIYEGYQRVKKNVCMLDTFSTSQSFGVILRKKYKPRHQGFRSSDTIVWLVKKVRAVFHPL